jgi:hypothetical protein
MRVVRGFSLKPLATTTWLIGAFAYAWQFMSLARRARTSTAEMAPGRPS